MTDDITISLLTLPIEILYRILDDVDILTIEISVRNVSTRLRVITDAYRQYPVNFLYFIFNGIIFFVIIREDDNL